MDSKEMTLKWATNTEEGLIAHKLHEQGFTMPVKLQIDKSSVRALNRPQKPMRSKDGKLIFALPGGYATV